MPLYSIGDVQGCFDELNALLTKINFNPSQDKLWFTGDLVNRGTQSLSTLRFIKSLGDSAITVLGNHDLHLLALAYGKAPSKPQDNLTDILTAPDKEELCEWLRQQPLMHHDNELNFTLVHAGLAPQWDLAKAKQCANEVETVLRSENYTEFLAHMYGNQPDCWHDNLKGWERLRVITNYFTRLRFCKTDGTLDLIHKESSISPQPDYFPWFKIPNRQNQNLNIIFGHWAALKGQADTAHVFALDTGCVWGNCLTAMRLEDKKYFSVPCQKYKYHKSTA